MICDGYSLETMAFTRDFTTISADLFFPTQSDLSPVDTLCTGPKLHQAIVMLMAIVRQPWIHWVADSMCNPPLKWNCSSHPGTPFSFKRNDNILRSFGNIWHWMNADSQYSHSGSMDFHVSYRIFSTLHSPCSWSSPWEGEFQHGALTHPVKTH